MHLQEDLTRLEYGYAIAWFGVKDALVNLLTVFKQPNNVVRCLPPPRVLANLHLCQFILRVV